MKLGPRAKLVLLALLFAAPIIASFTAYYWVRPTGTSNYGELLASPATITVEPFARGGGGRFSFTELAGQWVMVAAEPGRCDPGCVEKLLTLRQVRLALGRRASRVARVFVSPAPPPLADLEGLIVAMPLDSAAPLTAALADRDHIYLVDPHGNVMMRWPARPDPKRLLRDLERLLRASQIG
jgi:hypothetical protein